MKRIVSLMLAVMMTLALVACGSASATKLTMGIIENKLKEHKKIKAKLINIYYNYV